MGIFKTIFFTIFLLSFTFLWANEIRIITTEEPPTNYLNKNNQLVGITVDVVKKLQEELNLKNKIELITWARAFTIGKENPNVLLFTAGKTSHRVQLGFKFIGPIATKKHILYSKTNRNISIDSILDIKTQNLKIGAMRNDWRSRYFKDRGFEIFETSNHEQHIKKLMLGRIDLWASSNLESAFIAKKANIDMSELSKAYEFVELKSYIMFSKNTSKQNIKKWEKAFENLQETDFFEKTAKKWSKTLGIDLQYSKEKGFYKN